MPTEKHEIVAAAAIKRFKQMILEYDGHPSRLKEYLLKELNKKEKKAEEIISDVLDDIL